MKNRKGPTNGRRDLAIAALILGFVMLQLVKCSTYAPSVPQALPSPGKSAGAREPQTEHDDEEAEKKGDETQDEERAKIRGVARALQTIAADPEMQKTYGIKR
jgi:hypothetical protein